MHNEPPEQLAGASAILRRFLSNFRGIHEGIESSMTPTLIIGDKPGCWHVFVTGNLAVYPTSQT